MKIIRFERKPVALFVLAAFIALLCFWAAPLPSQPDHEQNPAVAPQKGEAHGPDFIEQEGKSGTAVKKHKKFPWWLAAAGGLVVAGVVLYLLLAKDSDDEDGESPGGKRVVLAEQFTATWCGYCPGASMGLDQLKDENPETLAVIAYHSSDEFYYANLYSARKSFYGVSGIPDVFFDGVERQTGGSATQSMYSSYKPMYDRRAAVPSKVELKLTNQGGNTVRIDVTNVSGQDLSGTFHFLIVEDDIPFSWQNQNVLRFVCRAMLPSAAGESVSLEAGKMKAFTRTYAIANDWNRANCHIVVFVQGGDKEICQGMEADLPSN